MNAGVGGSSPPITTIFQMPLFRGIFFAQLIYHIFQKGLQYYCIQFK